MKNIFKLIYELLETELNLASAKIEEYKSRQDMNEVYIEEWKRIEDISNFYPANYEGAAIIFEEWCKGLLTECRPNGEQLRKYARYTAKSDNFFKWINKGGQ
jgi:hypothetical protein